jgi:hypothetical protein
LDGPPALPTAEDMQELLKLSQNTTTGWLLRAKTQRLIYREKRSDLIYRDWNNPENDLSPANQLGC